MRLVNALKTRKRRTELSQSVARIVLTTLILGYFLIRYNFGTDAPGLKLITWTSTFYWIYSVSIFLAILNFSQPLVWRRCLTIVVDLGTISVLYSVAGDFGGIFLALYPWVIIGNGLRFGRGYLYFAMAVGLLGQVTAFAVSDYWQQHVSLAIGIIIGTAILPLFYAVILRELEDANHKLKEQIEQTFYAATHDALTDLPNRFLFMDRLQQAIEVAKRSNRHLALLYIDLDKFKSINDTLGHVVGDNVLVEVGRRIQLALRSMDSVARLGGDEFIVLLDNINSRSDAEEAANRIIKLLDSSIHIEGHVITVGCSVGISYFPQDADEIDALIRSADNAMYVAKKTGGNRYREHGQQG